MSREDVDGAGVTAAYVAARVGNTEVIRSLAATGLVDWSKGNLWGNTPLHVALLWGHSDVAEIITKQENLNLSLKTKAGNTFALVAVRGGSARCVELLAEKENYNGWNIPDVTGDTPLMLAIKWEMKEILQVLLNCPRVDADWMDC